MGINSVHDTYKGFAEQRKELADLLGASSDVISYLNMSQFQATLDKLQEKVGNDTFKIMVVGTFKNGKSTFINSILGEEILPAYSIPCTAVINEVKYGEKKKAVLYFRDPLPRDLPKELATRAQEHIRIHGGRAVPPMEIPYDEIEDYVVIPMGKDASEMLLESPYEKVELFWPLELLKNGVEIIDSPGLNEHATRTRVTMEYLSNADAILMVLNAQALCSESEMQFVENDLKAQGFVDPFFIVNRFDCIPKRERDMVKRFATAKLKDFTSFGQSGIYYVSSLDALEGKQENDAARYEGSGMAEFEKNLSDFLTKSKGRVKLAQPARELKRILNEEALYKVIPTQRKLLSTSMDEAKARHERIKPRLKDMTARKNQMYNQLMLNIERNKHEFRRITNRNLLDMIDNVPVWVRDYKLKTDLGLVPGKAKIQVAVKEISDHIVAKINDHQRDWKNKVLAPMIEEKASAMINSVQCDMEKIMDSIDQINIDISGGAYKGNPVPLWKRVAGVAGGILMGDAIMATSGAVNGIGKEFAITLAMELGAGFVLGLLGIFNPVTLVGIILAAGAFNVVKGQSNVVEKLKKEVTAHVIAQLESNCDDMVEKTTNGITKKFTEIADRAVSAMDAEIKSVEEQIQGVIKEMEKGKENVAARELVLNNSETKIKALNKRLDDLIFELVEG